MDFAIKENTIGQPYAFYESIYDLIGGAWIGSPFERMFGAGIGNPYSVLIDNDLNKILITSPIQELVIKRNGQHDYLNKTFSFSLTDSSWIERNYNDEFPDSIMIDFSVLGINPYNTSQYVGYFAGSIVISNNKGNTFDEIVDTEIERYHFENSHFKETLFDADSSTFYISTSRFEILRIKNDGDNWTLEELGGNAYIPRISIDPSNSGHIYLSDSTKVFFSQDYGETMEEMLEFKEEVTGLYKKPNSNILYVLTRTDLYEVENGQPTSIKQVPVSSESEPEIPEQITLHQNYPNPFNPSTTIQFDLKESAFTKLTVYDLLGRKVKELVNEVRPAGTNTVQFNASDLASGVYLYRLEAGSFIQTKRLTLIK